VVAPSDRFAISGNNPLILWVLFQSPCIKSRNSTCVWVMRFNWLKNQHKNITNGVRIFTSIRDLQPA